MSILRDINHITIYSILRSYTLSKMNKSWYLKKRHNLKTLRLV